LSFQASNGLFELVSLFSPCLGGPMAFVPVVLPLVLGRLHLRQQLTRSYLRFDDGAMMFCGGRFLLIRCWNASSDDPRNAFEFEQRWMFRSLVVGELLLPYVTWV